MMRITAPAVLLVAVSAAAAAETMVPFVIPPRMPDDGPLATSSPAFPAGGSRITVDGNRFVRDGRRVRIWGVNTCFGANFPAPDIAPAVAARMAAAGINSVRLHHMDTARWPRGIWEKKEGKTIEPEALARLDVFIDELAKRGICVNLNLHVGRAHSRYCGAPAPNTRYDKIVGIFTPQLVAAQKDYARRILDRVNTRRKVRYAEDPAVAFVEITNEDSLFMWSARRDLRGLPDFYAAILRDRYNAWLRQRYESTDALREAWSHGAKPLGDCLLKNPDIGSGDGLPGSWHLERHGDCAAAAAPVSYGGKKALRVAIERIDETNWHLQLKQGDVRIAGGTYYTLIVVAAAPEPRTVGYTVGMNHAPWRPLGLSGSFDLKPAWQTFRAGFTARAGDDNARVSFSLGGAKTDVLLARIELRPGGMVGLGAGESLEKKNVAVFPGGVSAPRRRDRMMFLADTERGYFDDLHRYIRKELGCGALVTGTIIFGPLGLYGQGGMDYYDAHAYWQHPRFPGRPWDPNNWLVNQEAMTDHPDDSTLIRLAAQRPADKPYTVSEYNHPAPNDCQAECVPLIASFAAAQDWDGIWLFTYGNAGERWESRRFRGFFDMHMNPAKWGFVRAAAAVFRDGGIAPLPGALTAPIGELPRLADLHRAHDRDMMTLLAATLEDFSWRDLLRRRVAVTVGKKETPRLADAPAGTEVTWRTAGGKGACAVQSTGARVYAGRPGIMAEATGGAFVLESPAFAAVIAAALDGKPLPDSGRVLVAACGRCENTGMAFSQDRRTVGRKWGTEPVLIEPVTGRLLVPGAGRTARALTPDGSAAGTARLTAADGGQVLHLAPRHATMWYLLQK